MIDEALGIKPKEKVLPQGQLDKRELDQLMGKGAEAEAEGAAGASWGLRALRSSFPQLKLGSASAPRATPFGCLCHPCRFQQR